MWTTLEKDSIQFFVYADMLLIMVCIISVYSEQQDTNSNYN